VILIDHSNRSQALVNTERIAFALVAIELCESSMFFMFGSSLSADTCVSARSAPSWSSFEIIDLLGIFIKVLATCYFK